MGVSFIHGRLLLSLIVLLKKFVWILCTTLGSLITTGYIRISLLLYCLSKGSSLHGIQIKPSPASLLSYTPSVLRSQLD